MARPRTAEAASVWAGLGRPRRIPEPLPELVPELVPELTTKLSKFLPVESHQPIEALLWTAVRLDQPSRGASLRMPILGAGAGA